MIHFYKCKECPKKYEAYAECNDDIKCPFCRHLLIAEPIKKTVLADVMKQNGSAIMREFLCQKCNKGPYWPVGAHIQASLCPTCGQRSECSGTCEVFPKATYIK
jgi:DNA-directed RNA polymerase subunit RPC12/RpoP